jgi:hypothetical protein
MRHAAIRLALAFALCASAQSAIAQVAVTRAPDGMMQIVGGPPDPDSMTIANAGSSAVNVTLTASGGFFSLSATNVTLEPRSARTIVITPTATEGGFYNGSVTVSAAGAARSLSVPVRLYIGLQSFGSVRPGLGSTLIIAEGLPGRSHAAQLSVSNFGSAIMTCMLAADVPWLDAPREILGVEPGATKRFDMSTNPSLRPDASAPLGAVVGTLSMAYLRGTSGEVTAFNSATVTAIVVDITKASVVPQQAAPLAPGEVATFLAGISDTAGVSHVFVSNRATTSIASNQLFYSASGTTASLLSSLGAIPAASSAWFPYSPQRLFDVTNQTGSVQLRTPQPSQVELAGFVEVVPDSQNIYVTALPVLSSAASAAGGETLVFSGIEKSAGASTDLHLQETAGVSSTYAIDFLDIAGAAIGTPRSGTLAPFQYVFIENVAPENARSIRVTNSGAGATRLAGYASVIDVATKDRWTVTDSRRSGGGEVFLPTLAAHDLAVWMTNTSSSPAAVTINEPAPSSRRRRAVHPGGPGATGVVGRRESTITLAPGESRRQVFPASPENFVQVSAASGSVAVSGSVRTSAAGRSGQFGSGVPAFSRSAAIGAGGFKQFSLADDQPGISPPSLVILETAGRPVTVRATAHFSFAGGTTATGQSTAFRDYEVAASKTLTVADLLRSILGPNRDQLGRLFKVVIDVQPVSGDGRVLAYLVKNETSGDVSVYAD